MDQIIWVTDVLLLNDFPIIKEYVAERIGPDSVTVKVRGAKNIIRTAHDRHFFTDQAELKKYVREFLEKRKKTYQSSIAKIEAALNNEIEIRIDVVPPALVAPDDPSKLEL